MPGTTRCCATFPTLAWAMTNSGITRKLANTNTNIARSQKRKLPETVIATSATAAIGTERYCDTPK